MKKLFALLGLALLSGAFALTVPKPVQVAAASNCTVTPLGNPTEGERYGDFIVDGRVAKIQFKVTGDKNCQTTVALKSYLAPAANGEPHDQQELQLVKEKTVGVGTHHIAIDMTPLGCFYQLDFVQYTAGNGNNKMLAFKLGGQNNCIPPTVHTCDMLTATKLSRVSYAYQAKATASGRATLTGYSFNFGDGQTATNVNGAIQHDYATPGTYKVVVNANFNIRAQFDGNGSTFSDTGEACKTTITVEQPPVAAYECTSLTATATSLYAYKYTTKYAASNGAKLNTVDFNFGDGATQIGVAAANLDSVNHTYAKAGVYTTTATLHFTDANGAALADVNCSAKTTIEVCAINPSLPVNSDKCVTTPPTTPPVTPPTTTTTTRPAELVHTGPASVVGTFAAIAIIGTVAHNLISRRRQA